MTENVNAWLQFLTAQGAQVGGSGLRDVEAFQGSDAALALSRGFVAPLMELAAISAEGEDAANFLHNQLTNDVEHLGAGEARLAGYCSPKGRLLATLLLWKSGKRIMLQLPRQIQAAVQKRLQMFVLRAKVKLADAGDEQATLGLFGQAAAEALRPWFPALPSAPFNKADSEAGSLIRLADAFGQPRYLWIAPFSVAMAAWPDLVQTVTAVGAPVWRLTEIHAGTPQITQPTQEQFVPQMVNFDLVGGVNFKKGCYPGQEIVARTQYLGKLKRRMLLASVDAAAASAGMELFSSVDPGQPCGMVVNAEPNLRGGSDCLVEVKLAAIDAGTVHLGSAQGQLLAFGELPYAFPA